MAEREKKGKKNGAEIGNGLLPIEHEAGRWAGVGAGRRAGGRQACRALGAGGRATAALGHPGGRGPQALGSAGERHDIGTRSAGGWAAGRHAGRCRRAGHGRLGGAWPAGRPGRGLDVQLGQVGCFGAPDSVFGLV